MHLRRPIHPAIFLLVAYSLLLFSCGNGQTPETHSAFRFSAIDTVSQPLYNDITVKSAYLPMRDDVQIAIDIALPDPLPAGKKLPTVMKMTRYWRAAAGSGVSEFQKFFASRGYAVITVDARGSGASFGTRKYELHEDEVKDYGEIVDWIIRQPWSNGNVGAFGVSYEGSTAELLTVNHHPAVKAVIPQFNEYDIYTDIVYPGGIFLDAFISQWAEFVYGLDQNEMGSGSVKPVDKSLLSQAIGDHYGNWNIFEATSQASFRDDEIDGFSYTHISALDLQKKIETSGAALSPWGSWMDAATADGVIKRFTQFDNQQLAVIGPWSHGAGHHASPYLPSNTPTTPSRKDQMIECVRFFDYYLKDIDNGLITSKTLFYYTMGEEKWKSTTVWPPKGSGKKTLYFEEDGALLDKLPKGETGKDDYEVNFEATTGTSNRWHTQLGGGDVVYPNRASQNQQLLTYTTAPLTGDIEITGHPLISLQLSSTESDGAIYVYLEDVAEDGRVYYLSEGQLRLIHQKVSDSARAFSNYIISRDYRRGEAVSIENDTVYNISFSLLPTSVLIKKGHRLRISIAGHDRDTFSRLPTEGVPVISIYRNATHASFVELPVIR